MVSAAERKRQAAKLAGLPAEDDNLGNPEDFANEAPAEIDANDTVEEKNPADGSVKPEAETIIPEIDPGTGTGDVGETPVLEAPASGRPTQESPTDAPVYVAQESATDAPIRIAQESAAPLDLTGTGIGATTIEEYVAPAEENAWLIASGSYLTDPFGNKYNQHGDMIDDDGNVFKTREEIMMLSDEELQAIRAPAASVRQPVVSEAVAMEDEHGRRLTPYEAELRNTQPVNPPQVGASSISRREAEMNRGREALSGRRPEVRRAEEMNRGGQS